MKKHNYFYFIPGVIFLFLFLMGSASANPIMPTSYDMINGGNSSIGTSLRDDAYAGGTGDPATAYSTLAGGLGDLTDGTITTGNWNFDPGPWVGWHQSSVLNPQITFYFDSMYTLNSIEIWVDGLYRPDSIDVTMGGTNHFPVTTDGLLNNTTDSKEWLTYATTGLSGSMLVLTLNDYNNPNNYNRDWILIGEVRFDGTPLNAIPEPTTMLLLGTGLVGIAGAARRRKKSQA